MDHTNNAQFPGKTSLHESQPRRSLVALVEGKEVESDRGAVATGPAAAARAGAEMFARGGNAMDAAAAAALACAVLEPESVDLGGYIFSGVVREGATGKIWSLDAHAVAPRSAHERMFEILPLKAGKAGINESEYDCSVADDANIHGPLSIAVPGFLAGVGTLWERWGQLSWPEIVAPSQQMVDNGFRYGPTAAAVERYLDVIRRYEPMAKHLMPEGKQPSADDIWHRPGLEKTLAALSRHGWREFYSGELGRRIGRYVRGIGGILTEEDMAGYDPRVAPAYEITYRGLKVFGSLLPTGALTTLEILKMIECFPPFPPSDPVETWHRLAEIFKLAWQDRIRYVGDPDYTSVPVERLLNKSYAQGRTEHLRQFPESVSTIEPAALPSSLCTIHVSAADAAGNVVAATISQGLPFGSCVAVPDTGVTLSHGMSRLDPRPGLPNSVASGKRPLSNVAPLIVSLPDRTVALGTRGGRTIVNVCAQLARRFLDDSASLSDALLIPRMHVCTREPVEFLEFEFTDAVSQQTVDGLAAMGHRVVRRREKVEGAGAAHCAEFLPGKKLARASGNTWAAGIR